MPLVSVVLPTKNEEEGIAHALQQIKAAFARMQIDGEIIVSDNSTDRTGEIARTMGAKVVNPDKLGYGYAYAYAIRHATGAYVILGDPDGSYDFEQIPHLLEPLQAGRADMVTGSRKKGKIHKGAMPRLHRYVGNPLLTWLFNRTVGAHLSDLHSGMHALTREALLKMDLWAQGWQFNSNLFWQAVQLKLRIAEVPIPYYARRGKSKTVAIPAGFEDFKFLYKYVLWKLGLRRSVGP